MKKLIICATIVAFLIFSCAKKIDMRPYDKKNYIDRENNDSIKSAVNVTIQQNPIIGFFNKGKTGDEDYYKIRFAAKGTSYKIVLSGVPGIDSRMELFQPDGEMIYKIDRNGIGESEVLSEYYPSSDYLILMVEAKTGYNEKVPYVINFIPKTDSGVNVTQPNHDEQNAEEIQLGDEKTAILIPGKSDYYKVTFPDDKKYVFQIKAEPLSNMDINFTIINKKLNMSKFINSYGWGCTEFYTFIDSKKGDYYIKVSGNINSNDRKDPIYKLSVTKLDDTVDDKPVYYEDEFNDTRESATELVNNAEVTGLLYPENDEDWYKLNLDRFSISVDLSLSSIRGINPIIEIYNAGGGLIKTVNEDNDSARNILLKNLQRGVYFIKLTSDKKSLQEYKLFLNIRFY